MTQDVPILWSFRRCPYAMRARLAIAASGQKVALREILLKDKPAAFLQTSPKGTVPALDTGQGVIEESRDIMVWALRLNDPSGWLAAPDHDTAALIDHCDGPFKTALDHVKYAVRFPDRDIAHDRATALTFLAELNERLSGSAYLFGRTPTLADMAILPFVRQFANTDRAWLDAQNLPELIRWLDKFLMSAQFAAIMTKRPPWQPGQATTFFPST